MACTYFDSAAATKARAAGAQSGTSATVPASSFRLEGHAPVPQIWTLLRSPPRTQFSTDPATLQQLVIPRELLLRPIDL